MQSYFSMMLKKLILIFEQCQVCLHVPHKQLLQRKIKKYSELCKTIREIIKDDTQFYYESKFFLRIEKIKS